MAAARRQFRARPPAPAPPPPACNLFDPRYQFTDDLISRDRRAVRCLQVPNNTCCRCPVLPRYLLAACSLDRFEDHCCQQAGLRAERGGSQDLDTGALGPAHHSGSSHRSRLVQHCWVGAARRRHSDAVCRRHLRRRPRCATAPLSSPLAAGPSAEHVAQPAAAAALAHSKAVGGRRHVPIPYCDCRRAAAGAGHGYACWARLRLHAACVTAASCAAIGRLLCFVRQGRLGCRPPARQHAGSACHLCALPTATVVDQYFISGLLNGTHLLTSTWRHTFPGPPAPPPRRQSAAARRVGAAAGAPPAAAGHVPGRCGHAGLAVAGSAGRQPAHAAAGEC